MRIRKRRRGERGFCRWFLSCLAMPILLCSAAEAQQPANVSPPPAGIETIITREKLIELKVGEKKRVRPESGVLEASVTRPEVVEGYLSGNQEVALEANSPGVGKIFLRLADGHTIVYIVRVYAADLESCAAELKEKLQSIQNLSIEVISERILVEGRILHLRDMDAIERAIGDNPSIINMTSLSSRNVRILAREIERALRSSGMKGVAVEVRKNRVTLVGTVASDVLVKKAEEVASTYTADFESLLKTGTQKGR